MANYQQILKAAEALSKGDSTDAEAIFSALAACFGAKMHSDMIAKLQAADTVCALAASIAPDAPVVAEVREWVDGGLRILKEQQQ